MVFSRDRRFAQRHRVKSAVRVRVWKSRLPEERTESVNLSSCGIFFLTESRLAEGEIVEIPLKMPEEISGEPTTEWRCTGHVVRVEPAKFPRGKCGVGAIFTATRLPVSTDPIALRFRDSLVTGPLLASPWTCLGRHAILALYWWIGDSLSWACAARLASSRAVFACCRRVCRSSRSPPSDPAMPKLANKGTATSW